MRLHSRPTARSIRAMGANGQWIATDPPREEGTLKENCAAQLARWAPFSIKWHAHGCIGDARSSYRTAGAARHAVESSSQIFPSPQLLQRGPECKEARWQRLGGDLHLPRWVWQESPSADAVPTVSPPAPPSPLGTMLFGESTSEQEAHKLLSRAAERGVNFFDSAEM